MRVAMGAGLALLLAGCGGAAVTTNTGSASGETRGEPPSGAKMSDAATARGGSNDCGKNPEFAPIYAGGKITVCSSTHFDNTGKDAGSFHYTTDAEPAAVLAFSKEHATRAGLTQRISTDKMFSAGKGDTTLMVMALPQGSGTMVTVNWGYKP